MVDERVGIMSAELGRREHDGMKRNVVLGHELVVHDLFFVLPPALPVLRVASRDAQIADGCVKPHVEYLAGKNKEKQTNSRET